MKVNYRLFAIAAIAGGLSFMLIGCETKTTQCNKLNKMVNTAQTGMQELAHSLLNKDLSKGAVIDKTIKVSAQYAKQFKALALEDKKLKGLQQRFSNAYQAVSRASRDVFVGASKNDPTAVHAALAAMAATSEERSRLTDEVNQYCGSK